MSQTLQEALSLLYVLYFDEGFRRIGSAAG
jgi:hypothetical protein